MGTKELEQWGENNNIEHSPVVTRPNDQVRLAVQGIECRERAEAFVTIEETQC